MKKQLQLQLTSVLFQVRLTLQANISSTADHAAKSDAEIRRSRLHFGMVFQSFNLFPQYTALENVMLAPLLLAKEQPDYKKNKREIHEQIEHRAIDLLIP